MLSTIMGVGKKNIKINLMTLSLEIDPVEALALVNDGGSLGASITLRNPHSAPILFRIQTTSPLTYRVKPSHGWVLPKSQQAITVLHVGQRGSTGSIGGGGKTDKFLIKYGAVGEEREELPDRDSPQASEAFTQMVYHHGMYLFNVVGYVDGYGRVSSAR